jgi:hypothetical protein
MSPTAPTFVTLNDRLNKAHHRIRELEARENELLAQNRALCAVITELTDEDPMRIAAELRLGPVAQSPPPAQTSAPASATRTNRVKTGRSPHV